MRRPVESGWSRGASPLLRLADSQFPALQLETIVFANGFGCGDLVPELDKGKPSRPSGVPIHRQKNVDDLAGFGKDRLQLVLRGLVTKISNEEF